MGGMELRVGSNIILFLYILLLLIWHMYIFGVCVYYTLLVVICIMFVKLTQKKEEEKENVVKRSEFVYTRD